MPTQITADLPTLNFPREVDYPTQEDWAAFSAAAELNFGILGGGWSTQMQLWKTQANAMSTELNTNATIAQGLANYQGDWLSQGYILGQTVSVGEVYYICKLTHTTGQNPTDVSSLYWNLALGNWSLKADKTEVALKIDKDISPYSSKPTPIDSDLIPLSDSASSFGIKKLSWANLKTTLFGSPALTGTPTAPTQSAQDNSTKIATTAYVDGKMVLGTAINSTSGTSIDFTGIPSWAKRITVMFNGVSTNGSTLILIRLGTASSIETTGYIGIGSAIQGSIVGVNFSDTAFLIGDGRVPSIVDYGNATINKLTNNNYCFSGITAQTGGANYRTAYGAGSKTLSGVLDRIRITTVNGTDTFDAGSINIMYEG